MHAPAASTIRETDPRLRLVPLVAIVFTGFLSIGLPLPALPLFVADGLGYGPVTVGWAVAAQAISSILSRGMAGSFVDRHGPRRSVLLGLPLASLCGLLYLAAAWMPERHAALGVLLLGRLLMGPAESLFLTGTMTWGIARIGPARTGTVMAWQGIAMFSALGAGAPLGIATIGQFGFAGVGAVTVLVPLLGLLVAWPLPAVPPPGAAASGPRHSFLGVVGLIWRFGMGLALGAIPFAVLTGFVVLFYGSRGWSGAGLALSGFAAGYIAVRLFLAHLPDKVGGRLVGGVSLAVEVLGQLVLWQATGPVIALFGATLTGVGFSLVFPSMGVEAMRRVPPQSRGLAVGAFFAFMDIATAAAGPLAGVLIGLAGYPPAFLAGAVACGLGCALVLLGTRRAPAG